MHTSKGPIQVRAVIRHPGLRRRVAQALDALGLYGEEPAEAPAGSPVLITDQVTGNHDKQVILIVERRRLDDAACRMIALGRALPLSVERLDALALEGLMLGSRNGRDTPTLHRVLLDQARKLSLPSSLISAFLRGPSHYRTLQDAATAMEKSAHYARNVLVHAGIRRAEHMWTAMRAESWRWFTGLDLPSCSFERWLGITDRSTFRRSCVRAGVRPPWRSE